LWAATATGANAIQLAGQRRRFVRVRRRRQLRDGGFEVCEHLSHGSIMVAMKRDQFFQHVAALARRGMSKLSTLISN
jgi:hypothetical protein